jgi:hypothetical protein
MVLAVKTSTSRHGHNYFTMDLAVACIGYCWRMRGGVQEGVVVHAHTFKIRATWAGHQTSTFVDTCTTFTKTKTEHTTSHARSSKSTTGIAKGLAALVSSNANVEAPTSSLHNTAARHNPPSHIIGYAEGDDNQW